MSSFTIDKRDYMRCAGLLAGIAEGTERSPYHLWVYDYQTNRNMKAEDYKREFEKLYQMNALSVQEQYHDQDSSMDLETYDADFRTYQKRGKLAAVGLDKISLKEWINNLNRFFGSAIYQTEKSEYMFQMEFFFGRIIRALLDLADTDNSDDRMNFYGSFDR